MAQGNGGKNKGPKPRWGGHCTGTFLYSPSAGLGSLRPHPPCNPKKFRCRKWHQSGLTTGMVLKGGSWQIARRDSLQLCSTAKHTRCSGKPMNSQHVSLPPSQGLNDQARLYVFLAASFMVPRYCCFLLPSLFYLCSLIV